MLLRRYIVPAAFLITTLVAFPFAPTAGQTYRSGNGQFLLGSGSNCQGIVGLTASLYVTQDLVAPATNASPGGGFSLQLNGAPNQNPTRPPVWWLQWIIQVTNDQVSPFIQYWYGPGVNEPGHPKIMNLPSNVIPAGYTLTIALTDDTKGNINGAKFSVADNAGNISSTQMPSPALSLPTYAANGMPILTNFSTFFLNLVGPPGFDVTTNNWNAASFLSGSGYLTYQVTDGQLNEVSPSLCGMKSTGEGSNASYGAISPPAGGSSIVQPVTTPYGGALVSAMDTVDNKVVIYRFTQYATSPQKKSNGNFFLNQMAFNGAWSDTNVSSNAPTPAATLGSPLLSYVNTLTSVPEVFYFVPNPQGGQQIEQLRGSTWSPSSLTVLANAQAAGMGSGLAGYIDPIAGTDNVFFQGTDQNIHVITCAGAEWTEDKRLTRAPVAGFASALTGHMNVHSQEIFYFGANRHVYELWRWSKNFDGWHSTDVTIASGSKTLPAIGSPLVGFYDTKPGTDALFYVGANQHVYELLFSSTWKGIDVTQAASAHPVGQGSSLAAHINSITNSEEVFSVNADQTLQELLSPSAATPSWRAVNIRSAAGSPPLASPGSPLTADINTVSSSTKIDEVYYVGTDGNIHELLRSAGSGLWRAASP